MNADGSRSIVCVMDNLIEAPNGSSSIVHNDAP
jgi:hypothetical protein